MNCREIAVENPVAPWNRASQCRISVELYMERFHSQNHAPSGHRFGIQKPADTV